ncbi:hypothetical protein D9M71_451800 [compost metagenome]
MRASIHLDDVTGEVDLRLSGDSHPKTLELNLISPTQPEKDRKITLTRSETEQGRYIGQLSDKIEGRRFVELLGTQDEHIWRMFEEELVNHDKDLLLGDEPLQGAEDLKK